MATVKLDGGASDLVTEAKVRFERAKEAYAENRKLAVDDTKFVLGDSDNGWQWPEVLMRTRSMIDKKPCLTVNVTAQHCNQIINNIRQNRPQCKILPADSNADKKTAEILGGMIRNIQVSSNADLAHDTAAEHAIYGGEGYWRIKTDYESPSSFNQVLVIAPIENPQLVYIDPFCGMDRLKAQWGFVFEDITKEECLRNYGIEPASWDADGEKGWVTENTVRIADYYYCENKPDMLYMLPDGNSILESEALAQGGPEAVAQIKYQAELLSQQTGGKTSRKTSTPKWKHCKLIGGHDKPVQEQDWAGSYLPIVCCIGKELNVNGKVVRKGVVRDLKDPARMVNYSYSGAVETISLQNKIPYIAAAEAIEGYEDEWAAANQSSASYLPFNAFDEAGNAIPQPKRQEPAVMPSAQVNMLQLSIEQMRAASGQQNANFGIKSEAASGVGIQRLKAQGEIATFHFPDNLARALHDEAVILLDLIPPYYDTKRIVRILGIDGKESHAELDPEAPDAHAEVDEYGITAKDVQAVFNPNVGRYDVVIDTGPSYQTQRQEAADAMTELSTRNPQLMQIAGDLVMKSYDFPNADKIAERFEKALPPELQDDKENKLPPEAQAKITQLEQQAKQFEEALNNASAEVDKLESDKGQSAAELEIKRIESNTKAYQAITQRLQVLGALMAPQEIAQLAEETKREAMEQPDPGRPPSESMGIPEDAEVTENPPSAGFFTPEQNQFPPAMAATGANPGPGLAPDPFEGNQNVR